MNKAADEIYRFKFFSGMGYRTLAEGVITDHFRVSWYNTHKHVNCVLFVLQNHSPSNFRPQKIT